MKCRNICICMEKVHPSQWRRVWNGETWRQEERLVEKDDDLLDFFTSNIIFLSKVPAFSPESYPRFVNNIKYCKISEGLCYSALIQSRLTVLLQP
jgi:hypothetical protein